jgi:hypothetical protein
MLREGAIADFTAACGLEPDNPVFRHNRGFCYRWVVALLCASARSGKPRTS